MNSPVETPNNTVESSKTKRRIRRRKFLAIGGLASAGMATAYYATRRHIGLGLIGAGVRGAQHAWHLRMMRYYANPYGKIRAICDAYLPNAEALRVNEAPAATVYQNYRDILARDDIPAVFIATPDHWHAQIAIEAMKAGKAVYCEKPLALTVAEGQQMVKVAKETGAIVQIGTQQRSQTYFRTACELLKNGRLGKLKRIVITLEEDRYDDTAVCKASSVPPGMDWDLWLGQTPQVEYSHLRQNVWRSFFAYSGGMLTDWGTHHLDIAHWGMGLENARPTRIDGKGDVPAHPKGCDVYHRFQVNLDYPDDVRVVIRTSEPDEANGILFEGDKGRVFCNRKRVTGKPVEDLDRQPLPPDAIRLPPSPVGKYGTTSTISHYQNFFHSIETGQLPIADIAGLHRTTTVLHLANISIRLGRPLRFDSDTERIIGDDEANAMLSRPRRSPYG